MTADELERASFKRYGRALVIRAPQPVERPTTPIPLRDSRRDRGAGRPPRELGVMTANEYVIEFRSGSFFVSSDAEIGGTLEQAKRFASVVEAEEYADANAPWVWFNGGAVRTVGACLLEARS